MNEGVQVPLPPFWGCNNLDGSSDFQGSVVNTLFEFPEPKQDTK